MLTKYNYDDIMLALAIWREARNQSIEGKRAVAHVILNRVSNPKGPYSKCHTIADTITQPYQFSSFNEGDPNSVKFPTQRNLGDWEAWLDCCSVVDEPGIDPTNGATHYFDSSILPPSWADPNKLTCRIGAFSFYKL